MSLELVMGELVTAVNKLTVAMEEKCAVAPMVVKSEDLEVLPPLQEKPKRKRRTKAEIDADEAAKNAPPIVEPTPINAEVNILAELEIAPPVVGEEIISVDNLKAELSAVVMLGDPAKKEGLLKAQELMAARGFAAVSQVPEGARPELVAALREVVKNWK